MNKLREDFKEFIMARFNPKNGTASSYLRAINCILDYMHVEDFDTAVLRLQDIKLFGLAPKNANEFYKLYPGFKIGESYIEKGFIKAAVKHFDLFVQAKLKESLGIIEDYDREQLSKYSETVLEDLLNYKDNASIVNITREVRARVLNRSIINNLKGYYHHRCQICEKQFDTTYSVDISEGHHIESFAKTFNNNADNIIVLCPDHHRLMHKANPILDRQSLTFTYQNGYTEQIKLADHFVKY